MDRYQPSAGCERRVSLSSPLAEVSNPNAQNVTEQYGEQWQPANAAATTSCASSWAVRGHGSVLQLLPLRVGAAEDRFPIALGNNRPHPPNSRGLNCSEQPSCDETAWVSFFVEWGHRYGLLCIQSWTPMPRFRESLFHAGSQLIANPPDWGIFRPPF